MEGRAPSRPIYLSGRSRWNGCGRIGEILAVFAVAIGIKADNRVQRSCPAEETARADQLDDFLVAEMFAQFGEDSVVDAVRIDHDPIHQRDGGGFACGELAFYQVVVQP